MHLYAALHICMCVCSTQQAYQELLTSRETLSTQLQEAQAQLEQSVTEVRSNTEVDYLFTAAWLIARWFGTAEGDQASCL